MSGDSFGFKLPKGDFGFQPILGQSGPRPTRKPLGKPLRDTVWMKYMGNKVEGKCYCCKIRPIHYSDFQVGHNRAIAKGGSNQISNLRPICGPCNRGMGTKSIEWYRAKHFDVKPSSVPPKIKRIRKKSQNHQSSFSINLPKTRNIWGP